MDRVLHEILTNHYRRHIIFYDLWFLSNNYLTTMVYILIKLHQLSTLIFLGAKEFVFGFDRAPLPCRFLFLRYRLIQPYGRHLRICFINCVHVTYFEVLRRGDKRNITLHRPIGIPIYYSCSFSFRFLLVLSDGMQVIRAFALEDLVVQITYFEERAALRTRDWVKFCCFKEVFYV